MSTEFTVADTIPAPAQDLYDAWLDSAGHTAMTGGAAHVSAEVGGTFDAWDGYISGKNLELVEEIFFREADHTYSLPRHREELVASVREWMKTHF